MKKLIAVIILSLFVVPMSAVPAHASSNMTADPTFGQKFCLAQCSVNAGIAQGMCDMLYKKGSPAHISCTATVKATFNACLAGCKRKLPTPKPPVYV